MPNDLSPICKALIQLFAREAVTRTIDDIEVALPDADRVALRRQLHMLVRTEIVRQAIRKADERLVYWLAGAPVADFEGTLFHYPDATFADAGDIPHHVFRAQRLSIVSGEHTWTLTADGTFTLASKGGERA